MDNGFEAGFAFGFLGGLAACVIGFLCWTFDATHDVSASMNQRVCMEIDDVGSKRCVTDKQLLAWLRERQK